MDMNHRVDGLFVLFPHQILPQREENEETNHQLIHIEHYFLVMNVYYLRLEAVNVHQKVVSRMIKYVAKRGEACGFLLNGVHRSSVLAYSWKVNTIRNPQTASLTTYFFYPFEMVSATGY